MASSDEDAPTPKCARGSGKVQRGRKIPFLTFTEERSYPPDYDYTRVLDYFSDEDRDESSHEEEEEEEERRLVMIVMLMLVMIAVVMMLMLVVVMVMMMVIVVMMMMMMVLILGIVRIVNLKKNKGVNK